MMTQNKLFRDSAFGNFRSLTQAMSLQPAMLYYLDNLDNVASSPNQNFARELMELFTLGVGNYTEADVIAAARAWTGHGIDWPTRQYEFHSNEHDNTTKSFMGVTRNWNGPDIIDYILRENTTKKLVACKFLTRKLWEFFAYQNPPQTKSNLPSRFTSRIPAASKRESALSVCSLKPSPTLPSAAAADPANRVPIASPTRTWGICRVRMGTPSSERCFLVVFICSRDFASPAGASNRPAGR